METSSYAWKDASFDQYCFHRDGAFEFDWGQTAQTEPVLFGIFIEMQIFPRGCTRRLRTSFGTIHLLLIMNGIMGLKESVGQKISQGQSTAQSLILYFFCIQSSVTSIPVGTSAPSAYEN